MDDEKPIEPDLDREMSRIAKMARQVLRDRGWSDEEIDTALNKPAGGER